MTSLTASSSSPTASATASACSATEADLVYLLSDYYDPERERCVAWDDPEIGIEWPIADPVLSERDRNAPGLAEISAG